MKAYKGYTGKVEYDPNDNIYHGRILHIGDIVTFAGDTVQEAERAFRDSVDDYLQWAKEEGFEPQKPGKMIAVNIESTLHRRASAVARRANVSVAEFVAQCLDKAMETDRSRKPSHHAQSRT